MSCLNYKLKQMKQMSCLITKKTIVVIVYRFNIEGLLELNIEAPIFVQLKEPVAQTAVVAALVTLRDPIIVVRHFLCP